MIFAFSYSSVQWRECNAKQNRPDEFFLTLLAQTIILEKYLIKIDQV